MQGFSFFLFFPFPVVNLTQRVRINSEESWNLWQGEISPHLRKLPLREYIINKLNITKGATENEFKTKNDCFLLEIIQRVLSLILKGDGTMDTFVFCSKIH